MNEQLKKFHHGDIVSGKVIEIEPSKALIKIDGCEPVYIIKEVASTREIESIEEVLQLNQTYEFLVTTDYSANYYSYNELYLSIVDLEYLRSKKRLEQLAVENITVYTKVIQAFDDGVLVRVENRSFIVSNIHLKTKTPNRELVGTTIPIKVILVKQENWYHNNIVVSHRWALLDNTSLENTQNTISRDNSATINSSISQQLYALGDVVVGKVIKVEKDYALVNVSAEKPAYVALRDISSWAESCAEVFHFNLIREFKISVIYRNASYCLALSSQNIDREIGMKRIEQMQEENVIFYSPTITENEIGNTLSVKVEGIQAFLPISHLKDNLTKKEVSDIPLQFLKEERFRLIVSNHRALFTLRLKQLKIGDLVTGKVAVIKEYGLFIDIGDVKVLLHISGISQADIDPISLNSIFQVGDDIKAIIIDMNIQKGRVLVSTRELEVEPGDMLKDPQLVYKSSEKMADRYRKLVIERLNISD